MNVCRALTIATAGSFLLVAAPVAHADNLAPALTDTALAASSIGEQTGTAAHGVAQRTGVADEASTVTGLVEAGAEAVSARDRSVDN
ncbi:hypothetical protein OG206_31090 [Streptomyces sp. NBC_01341]|uniref:hypothetical protein n=1 Tax=Streptomyces sp. NBC_01341 TaxID=2903831 RepID=UPI002E119B08|nr:hypothetical protein OG206_31090 [Streptomyces sp. NBC_01341]